MSSNGGKLLSAATQLVGGPEILAEQLHISEAMLRKYVEGAFPPPDSLVLAALDLLQQTRESFGARADDPAPPTEEA